MRALLRVQGLMYEGGEMRFGPGRTIQWGNGLEPGECVGQIKLNPCASEENQFE